jgi:hypothetical protein
VVSIIENWVLVFGIVTGLSLTGEPGSDPALTVRVEQVRSVAEFPNLLQAQPGDQIEIQVRRSQLEAADELLGKKVVLRVRRAGPTRLFAHPDWTSADPARIPAD